MLRIPEEGEAVAHLMMPIQKAGFSAELEAKGERRRGKRKNVKGTVALSRKNKQGNKQGNKKEGGIDWLGMLKTTVIWGVFFAVIAGGVFLFLETTKPDLEPIESRADPDAGRAVIETPMSLTAGFDETELVPEGGAEAQ